ncbi:MAG: primosomal protein N' [Bacteroidaceae bacterium]|nr:primosomal protein N' [Bacteroidaceae bacterium]
MGLFADVILPVPFETFTYAVPTEMEQQVVEGSRVLVQLGKTKTYAGIVLRLHAQPPADVQIKSIMQVLDAEPIVTQSQFRFWQWIATYYLSPLGDVYKAAFPGILKKAPTGGTKRKGRKKDEAPLLSSVEDEGERVSRLNPVQQQAYDAIQESWQTKSITLLHGVTSSGKTEIYIHLILQCIREGKQVLYLLPEIALTTQITERLRKVFGDRLGVYHSKFSDKDRAEVYQRQLSDEPFDVILGVRSSVFLPFQRLGLVIVDEEHETSYKQQDPAPRYHARSAAIMLAQQCGAKTLLGTATPSIETYYLAQQGRYGYVALTQRFANMQLPHIEVVDIKRLKFQKRMKGAFSPRLLEEIGQALERKEQVILFQNRRGFSSFVQCKQCGWVPRCQHCDVSLTYHKKMNNLSCHYCGKVYPLPPQCPECGNKDFGSIGTGTEKIEEQIHKFFPQARVSRMDLDTAKTRAAYEKIIDEFAHFESDILIGTQMVSKGLDFDNVSVVGILDADTMLNIPDFRSYERSFHTLAQVAGRAGRKNRVGKVILQTRSADAPIIQYVMDNDYASMFREQVEERQLFHYPPFYRIIYVYLRHRDNALLQHLAEEMARTLRQSFGDRVLGPDRPVVSRVQSMHIRKIIIKMENGASPSAVRAALVQAQNYMLSIPVAVNLHIYYDVDPQ